MCVCVSLRKFCSHLSNHRLENLQNTACHVRPRISLQALVAQEPVLFNTSVRQNLLYGLPQCRIDSDPKDLETCVTGAKELSTTSTVTGQWSHPMFGGPSSQCHGCHVHSLLGKRAWWPLQDFEEQMIAAAKAACAHVPC